MGGGTRWQGLRDMEREGGEDGGHGRALRMGDPGRAEEVLRENQERLKARVTRALGGAALAWSDARAPCLATLRPLTGYLDDVENTVREAILRPPQPKTVLEGRQGARLVLESTYEGTVAELASFFAEQVLPARLKPDSRKEYDRAWRSFVTYAVAYDALSEVFPSTRRLLHGYVSHLLAYQYAASTIIKHIAEVVARNKDYGFTVLGFGDLKRYTEAIKRVLVSGAQRTRFRLFPHHLQAMARLDLSADHTGLRNVCMIMLGTIGACRKSELVQLDVCDWVEGRDRSGATGASLGAALNIRAQKNSLGPRSKKFAFGNNGDLCLVRKMRVYLESTGLGPQPGCWKWAQPGGAGVKCAVCGPLFPAMPYGRPTANPATRLPLSKGSVAKVLVTLLDAIGADHRGYTTKSMRQGGLSTAKRAGICKSLRMAQSGHRSKAHAAYESDSSSGEDAAGVPRTMPRGGWRPEELYHFSRQFVL